LTRFSCITISLRHDAGELITYLGAEDPQTRGSLRIHTVINWALTLENNKRMPGDFDTHFRFFQVNRNASTVLSYPSKHLYDDFLLKDSFFMDKILKFTDSALAEDPFFAGHWQQIIKMFFHRCITAVLVEHKEEVRKMLIFVVTHADILVYQYLVSRLIVDFRTVLAIVWKQDPVLNFIIMVLDEACQHLLILRTRLKKSPAERAYLASGLFRTKIAGRLVGKSPTSAPDDLGP
jgi:hypothetical protein